MRKLIKIFTEYGYMLKITEKSDVYSFGVVMLEVLTGKQPIDPTIPDGLHIVDWVRQRRCQGVQVLDSSLRSRPEPEIDEMLQTVGVAMLCVNPSPSDRPAMKDVSAMLEEIRQDRSESMKVDVVRRESSNDNSGSSVKSPRPATVMNEKHPYSQSNNTSFSASSLLYSSSCSSANNNMELK